MTAKSDHKAIVEEIRALAPEIDEEEFLTIPAVLELAIMARQRQTLRNTAVLNRNTSTIARVAGRADESRKLGQQMKDLIKDMVEIDRRWPDAKKRMQEMDEEAAKRQEEARDG